jgi:hypothetical protein
LETQGTEKINSPPHEVLTLLRCVYIYTGSVDQAPVTGKVEEITIASVENKVHFHISLQLLIVCPFFVAI